MAEALGLKEERTSRLSCDDMYRKLCEYEGICEKNDILFCDEQMPKLNTYLEGEEVCRRTETPGHEENHQIWNCILGKRMYGGDGVKPCTAFI